MWAGSSLCGTMLRDHFKLTPSQYHSVLVDLNHAKGLVGIYKRGKSFVIVVDLPRQRSYEDMLIGGAAVGALASAGALVHKAVRDRQTLPVTEPTILPLQPVQDTRKDNEIKQLQTDKKHLEARISELVQSNKTYSQKLEVLFPIYGDLVKMIPVMDVALIRKNEAAIQKLRSILEGWKTTVERQTPVKNQTDDSNVKRQIRNIYDQTMVLIDLMSDPSNKLLYDKAEELRLITDNTSDERFNLKKTLELGQTRKYIRALAKLNSGVPLPEFF
jgi:hypothetical protein